MKMPRVYTFDVPDFDDYGGRTTRRVEVPKAVFRQIEADVAAPLEATIHQLGENAAKAGGEYAEEVGRLREERDGARAAMDYLLGDPEMPDGVLQRVRIQMQRHNPTRAALTEPTT